MKNIKFYINNSVITKNNLWNLSINLLLIITILINISCVKSTNNNSNSSEESKTTALESKVGSYIVFNCHIDFPYEYDIPYVILWSKDGKNIYTWYGGEISVNDLYSSRLSLIDNHEEYGRASLNLTSIRESDQGWYHCQIVFPNRTPSTRNNGTLYQLTVEGGSLIKIPPVNLTIQEGQVAFFHCIMKHPESSTLTWFKDGVPLSEVQNMKDRIFLAAEGTLSIDPTLMSDLGEYECNIQNDEGERQISRAFLNIQYKAKVIYAPPEIYLPYAQSAILDCHFRSNPPLQSMRWEKDGLLFDSYNVPGVYYKKNNGSLFFEKVDETFAGSYTCTPFNELGTDGSSPVIHVIVQRPPVFTIQPKSIYITKLNDTVQFACEAIDRDRNNRPTITWIRKDGLPLPEDRHRMDGGNLTIEQVSESDRGIYECAVTNEAATVTVETELMIENAIPRAPHDLIANSTENEITLQWKSGFIQDNVEYMVMYRLVDSEEWRSIKIHEPEQTEATIHNLLTDKEYELMVLSQNSLGYGMISKSILHSTKPLSTEKLLELSSTSSSTSSSSAADKQLVTTLSSITVTAETNSYENSNELNDPEKSNNNPIESTQPPTEFEFLNGKIGAPRNIKIEERHDGFYQISWEPPKNYNNNLQLYLIKWWHEPDRYLHGQGETINTEYLIKHLREDYTYNIQVFSLSSIDGELIGSEIEQIQVPSSRKLKAIAIGCSVAIIFLITAVSIFLYVRKNCFNSYKSGSDKIGTD